MKSKFINLIRRNINGKRSTIFFKPVNHGQSYININATHKNKIIGSMDAIKDTYIKRAYISDTMVSKDFRKSGVSTGLFKTMAHNLKRSGIDEMIGHLTHVAQVKIRSKYNTKFYRKVNDLNSSIKHNSPAINRILKNDMLEARTNISDFKTGYKRIRIRGRWLTIKRKE